MIGFQHQSEVRQVALGEFDLPMSIAILRQAQRELDGFLLDEDGDDFAASWDYCCDVRRAERFTIYGEVGE